MTGTLVHFAQSSPPQICGSLLRYSCQSAMSPLYEAFAMKEPTSISDYLKEYGADLGQHVVIRSS